MPSADSSTIVARSPAWSCARRAARENRRSSASVSTVSGTAVTATTSPNKGESHTNTPMPTTSVSPLTTRKIPEKATNHRIVVRSDVARDSSCPDAHRSWNATGSRCRCANRSARMDASMRLLGRATSIRRTKIRNASTRPNTRTPSTSQGSVERSPRAIGPSTMERVHSGTANPKRAATSAARPLPANGSRWGAM